MRCCFLIPVYNHPRTVTALVDALKVYELPVLLVDDGSEPGTAAELDSLASRPTILLHRLPANQGKGAAVMAGLRQAQEAGFSHALQIDADGQHDIADVARLLELARQHPQALISGHPVYDESVPAVRKYGRYLTHALVWLETLSLQLIDSMCGFRVYPVDACVRLGDEEYIGKRMDFDSEIMVRLFWRYRDVHFVPTRVIYPPQGRSHFRMVRDNARMTFMHGRLLLGMVLRSPKLLIKRRSLND
jgi:glycosyltransferase involved in cell wall biosynthesis